ncbi:MAG: hypothetical protein COY40_06640 [Alphaproteobacteria bacterium CG_4_10_14_0_8_um_filter_53_9]|nr:MAG: hypothetical protein COY40_06640 [Alphaproteobacteria bacterium CG_4_10_14_0_8_um_filter_53_9]
MRKNIALALCSVASLCAINTLYADSILQPAQAAPTTLMPAESAPITLMPPMPAPGSGEPIPITLFSPDSLSGLALWLKADDIALSNGSPISSWPDNSPLGNTVTGAGVSSNKPIYVANAGDGSPTIAFAGGSNKPYFDVGSDINAQTVFFVNEVDADAPSISCITTTKNGGYPYSIRVSGNAWRTSTDVNDWINPSNTLYVNGSAGGNMTKDVYHMLYATKGGTSPTKTLRYIGAEEYSGRPFKGSIREVVWFTGVLSASEREKVEGYLAHRWNLTSSLPVDHPYKASPPTS